MEQLMKILLTTVSLLIISAAAAIAQTAKPTINDLAWLAGCWEGNLKGSALNEQWMKPAGGVMLGMGRTVAGGKVREYEFLQIREEADGAINYVARPSGQPEASFKLKQLQHNEVIFENAEHDFPQRVIYRLQSDGSLFARIEGTSNGKARGFDYPLKRAQCN
jgi:Domain of unknown function (DUF6265)